jgi:hypothetical protein
MPTGRVVRGVMGVAPIIGAMLWVMVSSGGAQAASSEQVVFSKTGGFGVYNGVGTPFGFWIWCEADSTNPYHGVCSGSMYFYNPAVGVGIAAQPVSGSISEPTEHRYVMSVQSLNKSISCLLSNQTVVAGPNNSIDVKCTLPSGDAIATGAIVNVTGP